MNEYTPERIVEIRERLTAWKAKANTCIDFNALDVDALFAEIEQQRAEIEQYRARISEIADYYAMVSDDGSDSFYDRAKTWFTDEEKSAAFARLEPPHA